jgi:hypothetical protein
MQQSCFFRKSFASHPLSCLLIVAHPPSPLTPHVLASNQDPSDSNRVFFENRLRLIHCFFLFHYLLCCLLLTPHSPPPRFQPSSPSSIHYPYSQSLLF